jgi:hypothetical protein
MKRTLVLCLLAALSLQAPVAHGQTKQTKPAAAATTAMPLEHGGKIESEYDGFAHETIVALKSMTVTCDRVRGAQGVIKGVCVNLTASLHCPGKQLDYVRHVRLRLAFEAKNWDNRHPLGERVLSAVADGETLRLGEMTLLKQEIGEGWFDERMKEVLEVSVPYAAFQKLARAGYVEMSVGKTSFALREKNVAALRDLNNRVGVSARSAR